LAIEDFIELLDSTTLKRLDLPKTATSPQGLDNILMEKSLQLAYITNDPNKTPHKTDVKAATVLPAAGLTFAAPTTSRYSIFSMRLVFTASATVGSRIIAVDRLDKANNLLNRPMNESVTAGLSRVYTLGPASGDSGNINISINFPFILEPEWKIQIDDTANIDPAADTVSWVMEYQETTFS